MQADRDVLRLAVFESVVDCFLGDEIQVSRREIVRDCHWSGAVKRAGHLPLLVGPGGQFNQGSHQSVAIHGHGEQSAQDGPKLSLAALQSLLHPFD
jgi:hypothetical protein